MSMTIFHCVAAVHKYVTQRNSRYVRHATRIHALAKQEPSVMDICSDQKDDFKMRYDRR